MPRLFVIADSISIHYGPYLKAFLGQAFDYDRKGGGADGLEVHDPLLNGGDSQMVLDYLTQSVDDGFSTDWLLLNCGLHDVKRQKADVDTLQVDADRYEANLKLIVGIARPICEKLIWVRTTPVDDARHARHPQFIRRDADVRRCNAIADSIMAAADVSSIDLYGMVKTLDEPLYVDHVHFTESVRRQQAAFIAGHLRAWARM